MSCHAPGWPTPRCCGRPNTRVDVDQDEHWALVRRMLHGSADASVEDRTAACLVLLYAQPVSKIVALTTAHLDVTDGGTYLRLGPEPLLLLRPLDVLVTSLPIAKPFGAASTLADERWLFPGNGPATTSTRPR